MHVGQAVVAALEAGRQLRVVEAELLQDRRLQVVDVDGVLGRREAEFVGRSVVEPPLDPGPRQPDAEAVRVVVATQHTAAGRAAFAERRPTELAAPDDERIVEQTEQCLRNIESALREAGAALTDVVRVTYMLPNSTEFE